MNKINLIITGLIALLLFSCNPNKEVYEELDAQRVPFNQSFSYTLTEDDYTTIKSLALAKAETAEDSAKANDIATYLSFSEDRPADEYIPDFLSATFIALDSASSVRITYNYDYSFTFDGRINLNDTVTDPADIASFLSSEITEPHDGDFAMVVFYLNSDGAVERRFGLYQYLEGKWTYPDDYHYLSPEDYTFMGLPYEFSADNSPAYYLPIFLAEKYPFATNGETKELIYKYNDGSHSSFRYNKLIYDGNQWAWYEAKADQYLHNGEKWVFDPTVSYTMISDDYQIIVDWIAANDTLNNYVGYDSKREFYFGANAKYSDFNMYLGDRKSNDPNGYLDGLSDDEIKTVIYQRLIQAVQIVLEEKFPTAVPFVNGVPVYYNVTFLTWDAGATDWYTIKYLCTETGKFEYVEGPTAVE